MRIERLEPGLCKFFGGMYWECCGTIGIDPWLFDESNNSELMDILLHELGHKAYHDMKLCDTLTEMEREFCEWFHDYAPEDDDEEEQWIWIDCRDLF